MTTDTSLTFAQRLLEGRRGNARIPARAAQARAPLSSTQQRIYFLCRLAPNATNWQAQRRLVLRGALDVEQLVAALRTLQEHHAILRTRLAFDGDTPSQVVVDDTVEPTIHDVTTDRDARIASIDATHARPFDLHAEPFVRIDIARIRDDHHLLWVTVHHIVCDGWSMRLLFRDLDEIYTARIEGRAPALAANPISYGDYAAWEQTRRATPAHATHVRYWHDQLRGVAPLALPYDRTAPALRSPRGARWYFEIDAALGTKLERLSARADVTPFVVFVAAFKLLLARYVGGDDICVATPVASRTQRETRDLVGPLFNTILLRTDVGGAETFTDLIRRERGVVLDGFAHQQVSFDEVAREVRGGPQLFNVLVNSPAGRTTPITLGGLDVELLRNEIESIETDLSLDFLPQADSRIRAALSYDRDRFSAELVERIGGAFQRILAWVVEDPDRPLAELDLLSPDDHAQLAAWNATARAHEGPQLVHELVASQAARTPDAIAVEDAHQRVSYRELVVRIDRVAGWLAAHGVCRGSRITVAVTRSVDMVAAMLGVLRVGAAYIPIDPEFPAQRRAFMRDDAGAALELDDNTLADALACNAAPPRVELSGEDVAYILYTSGSTGLPKGVSVPHRAVVNFLRSMQREPGITADDTLIAVTTLSFDIAGLELYLPLVVGAKVVIADRDTVRDGDALARLLDAARATIMQATPATWRMLLATGWRPPPKLTMLCGGEPLPPDLAAELTSSSAPLWNLYGPTETTIWSTVTRIAPGQPISIGHPVDNTTIYVLDDHRRLAPIGVAGELFIGGRGVALGYHARAALTADRFVADPFAGLGAVMYRTGDRVRWTLDGSLEHLGRLDSQIKLRGFRIELGEIEAALRAVPGVVDAAVTVLDDVLVGYLVPRDESLDTASVQTMVRETLPAYMVPAAFVVLERLPVTPNGKLDRKALPAPDRTSIDYVAPRTSLERQLADIWRDVLRVERVSVHDDFFALGGHSLLAIRLLAGIERRLGVKVPLRELFADSTLGGLASKVVHARTSDDAAERPTLYASSARRARLPAALRGVYTLNKMMSTDLFARHVWSAWIDGPIDLRSLEQAVAAMRERHALLRTRFFEDGRRATLEVLDSPEVERFALLDRVDLSATPDQEQADIDFHRSVSFRALDVEHGEVMSVALSRWSETRHRLTVSLHNIVSDAESLTIYVNELCELWRAFADARDPSEVLPPAPLQYHHLADYLDRVRKSDVGLAHRGFWNKRLDGMQPLELPTDFPRDEVDARRKANAGILPSPSRTTVREIGSETLAAIERLAESQRATVMSTLVAAMAGYLSERSSQQDLTFITRLSHRYIPGLERALGFLVNPIVLRVSTAGAQTFSELVARTHDVVTDAFDHGECDLFDLAPYSAFRFNLVYTRGAPSEGVLQLPSGTTATKAPPPGASAESQIGYDLLLWLQHLDGRIRLYLAYNLELFRQDTATALLDGFVEYVTAHSSTTTSGADDAPVDKL